MFKNNKIFLKIGLLLTVLILIFVFLITFLLNPKISQYLVDFEINQAKTQLNRVSSIIESKEKYLEEFHEKRVVEHKNNIRNISHVAHSIMDSYYEMFKKGLISRENAIEYSYKSISKLEYGHKNDYIYVLNRMGTLVYHPDENIYKKNIIETQDINGKYFVEDIINNAIKNKETYTNYLWKKLKNDLPSEKIVHSIYFEPFDLIISTGVYIDNIKQELEDEKKSVISNLLSSINSILIDNFGYIIIVNSKGELVLYPDKKLISKNINSLKEASNQINIMDSIKKAYEKKEPWLYTWDKQNDQEKISYKKIALVDVNEFFDWYIISSVYEEDLELKAKYINNIIVKYSSLVLLVLAFIAIIFIRKLLDPITILSKNADLVKSGDLTVRNNIDRNDELGELANHFNRMLDSIEENTKNLESKVESRTKEIEHKLYYDELTGLKNRESLRNDLKLEQYQALSLVDIDGFDDVNELYGFDVGNEVLIEVMEALNKFSVENNVLLYRLNSDVFAILDNHLEHYASYDKFLENIQNIFKKEVHIKSLDIDIFLYVTIGTSISQADPIKSANIALKRAKQIGLKYIVYNKDIDTKDNIKKTMYWREKIKLSIEDDKIVPFYQAIFNRESQIIKYETLMRIYDEIEGKPYYLSPGTFLEVASKTKQYLKLNEIVIKKTFENIENIEHDISINISFIDVMCMDFSDFIEKEIDNLSKKQRERVVFEILESDNISDYEVLDKFIFKYRNKGIRIAIDDFGTGFSNFSHILKVKPDYIKIDGSLIKNIDTDDDSYQMVKSIVEFSQALGIKVIAEYIHNKEVYEIVRKLNVDEFQGFYLGEPAPLDKTF